MIQYSFTKDSDGQYDKMPTDWYCNCGVFNFKRRENCFKCSASREESEKGGEGSDEISNILTKSKFDLRMMSQSYLSLQLFNRNHVEKLGCFDERGESVNCFTRQDSRISSESFEDSHLSRSTDTNFSRHCIFEF